MGATTGIEWTDATWNPLWGCSRVSEGCRHCYAERTAARLEGAEDYSGVVNRGGAEPRWTGKVRLIEKHLLDPLKWKPVIECSNEHPKRGLCPECRKRLRIFVNSMSDLFHENVPEEWIDRIFAVMALCPQHTFQVLTKRPERMRAYIQERARWTHDGRWNHFCVESLTPMGISAKKRCEIRDSGGIRWPLPNVWLGVSVENQATADERIPLLLQTPAVVRFISAEPLLGPVDLDSAREDGLHALGCGDTRCECGDHGIDWVICGGESGSGARPMRPDWARSLRSQCAEAGVPFFFKRWGSGIGKRECGDGFVDAGWDPTKKKGGALLDGREHKEFPA